MYHLAALFPPVKRVRIALSRDQFMLLMLASNELLLGLETYIAHLISGTIVPPWPTWFFCSASPSGWSARISTLCGPFDPTRYPESKSQCRSLSGHRPFWGR